MPTNLNEPKKSIQVRMYDAIQPQFNEAGMLCNKTSGVVFSLCFSLIFNFFLVKIIYHTSWKMSRKLKTRGNPYTLRRQPSTSSTDDSSAGQSDAASILNSDVMSKFKKELLLSLFCEMSVIFKAEFHDARNDSLSTIKTELQSVKTELSAAVMNTQVSSLKGSVSEIDVSLSACTDDIVALQAAPKLVCCVCQTGK